MLQFDRIKIRTSFKNIIIPTNNNFIKIVNNEGEVIYTTFSNKIPSLLNMRIDHRQQTVVLEFTAKILGEQYPDLISVGTIKSALQQVALRTGCTLNEDGILNDAIVLLVDVTKDIPVQMTHELKQELFMSCSNLKKWRVEIHKQNGIEIRKAVRNKSKCRERLSLYCKPTEMQRSENKAFLASLDDDSQVLKYFQGRTRIEYNLTSSHMIKEMLAIENTSLRLVLESAANPLLNFCRRVFDLDSATEFRPFKKISEFYIHLLLDKVNDDVRKAEEIIRHFYSPRSNFRNRRRDLVRVRNIRQSLGSGQTECAKRNCLEKIIASLEGK